MKGLIAGIVTLTLWQFGSYLFVSLVTWDLLWVVSLGDGVWVDRLVTLALWAIASFPSIFVAGEVSDL